MSDYRYRDQAKDGANVIFWIFIAFVVTALITLAWVFFVNPMLIDKQGDNFRNSYGSEQARIDAARQAVVAIEASNDEGQIAALTNQACALIADTSPSELPPDLAGFQARSC